MKKLILIFAFLMVAFSIKAQNQENSQSKILKIKLTAEFNGEVGYGTVFKCKLVEVIEGELNDKDFLLVITASDKKFLKLINSNLYPNELIIEFRENLTGNVYISGMKEKNKIFWMVSDIKKL